MMLMIEPANIESKLISSNEYVLLIVDTFMLFFRAYYNRDGLLVYDLRKIARNYLCSGAFIVNLIASLPMQFLVFTMHDKYGTREDINQGYHLLGATQLLKLLRITPLSTSSVNSLTKSSIAVRTWWERQDIAKAMLAQFIFKLVMVSHCIACFWSFLPFVQVGGFGSELDEQANWISNWYKSNQIEGGINPIGWENDIDRYALSLFWSIQSLTSIGYGNIVPVTRVEYYFANILMIFSGLFWAFLIANIVSIAAHMNQMDRQYKIHLAQANNLIGCFEPTSTDLSSEQEVDAGVGEADAIAQRIRRFVTSQYGRDMLSRPSQNSPTLNEIFPQLDSLSLELRRLTSLHLLRKYIEMVPYLSGTYLTPKEQSDLAFKCIHLEFCRGETFDEHPTHGRGIMILRRGFCVSIGTIKRHGFVNSNCCFELFSPDKPIGIDDVLVEDCFLNEHRSLYRFVAYSLLVFIPRSVIMEVLNKKKRAWKECARWRYARACLLKWAREVRESSKDAQYFNGTKC